MPFQKLQHRIGGLKICQTCDNFEAECAPYVHLLERNTWMGDQERTSKFALHSIEVTLFDSLAELRESAKRGCHHCLIWHKAIMNECHSTEVERILLAANEMPVVMEVPSVIDTSDPFSALIKILSPVEASVRVAYSAYWNDSNGDAKIPQDPKRESMWKWIRKKMQICKSNHVGCSVQADRLSLPSRLVHIHDEESVSVCETLDLPTDLEYVALSYVWGGDQVVKLTVEQEPMLKEGVPQNILPQTLRDTFKACRLLGISYVWIDALCIRQDDKGVDFHKELENMDQIYGLASITLVAASIRTADEGFLMDREIERDFAADSNQTFFGDGRLFIHRKGLSEVRARSPLATRGWCFQEEQLSKRLLYCTSHGMFWSCAESQGAENGSTTGDVAAFESVVPVLDPHFFLKSSDRLYIWDQLVEQYSVRDLTLQADRLPAISGLARSIEQLAEEKLLFGMWPSRLPVQLLWITLGVRTARAQPDDKRRAALEEIPSWSWAATPPSQAVRMPGSQISYSKAKLEKSDPANPGCLRLRGRMRHLLLDHSKLDKWPVKGGVRIGVARQFEETDLEANLWASTEAELFVREAGRDPVVIQLDRPPCSPFEDLLCFEINYKGLLLLELLPGDEFKRVGCCQLHNDSAFFAGAETATINLI